MSGWERAPEYGSKPSNWPSAFMFGIFILSVFVLAPMTIIYMSPATQNCREVRSADVPEVNGKAVLDLRSLNLKGRECVTVRP